MRELAVDELQLAEANFQDGIYRLRTGRPAGALPLFEASACAHTALPTVGHWRTCNLAGAQLEATGEAQLPPALLEEMRDSGDQTLFAQASLLAAALTAQDGEPFAHLVRQAVDTAREIGIPIDGLVRAFAAVAVRANEPRSAALLLGRETDIHLFASSGSVHRLVRAHSATTSSTASSMKGHTTDDEIIALALTLGAP